MQIAIHVRHQLVFGWYAHKGLALQDLSLIVSLKRNSVNHSMSASLLQTATGPYLTLCRMKDKGWDWSTLLPIDSGSL